MFSVHIHLLMFLTLLVLGGCASPIPNSEGPPTPVSPPASPSLKTIAYSVQVGAFSKIDNARRFVARLEHQGVDAFFFRHASGLYKVRFGDYLTAEEARVDGQNLVRQGLVSDFFIVPPSVSIPLELRRGLVEDARRFIGVPYSWGGESRRGGFDCSGLTMTVYRLQGLNLPRTSRAQFHSGRSRSLQNLRLGDLVFFATNGGERPSHVGIYVGEGKFIHAPGTGKTVRIARLDTAYFAKNFIGARSYLDD